MDWVSSESGSDSDEPRGGASRTASGGETGSVRSFASSQGSADTRPTPARPSSARAASRGGGVEVSRAPTASGRLQWSIGTFARLKPHTTDDRDLPFVPYTIHARARYVSPAEQEQPRGFRTRWAWVSWSVLGSSVLSLSVRSQSQPQRRGRALRLLEGPTGAEAGESGSPGDSAWELDSGWSARGRNRLVWQFDDVFDTASAQDEVYAAAASPLVEGVMEGYNGTLFAYGQTGSGKTFTVQGGEGYQNRGLIPRAVQDIFDRAERKVAAAAAAAVEADAGLGRDAVLPVFKISVCFCEIYNERVYDLLETGASRTGPIETWPHVDLKEDGNGALRLKGLKTFRVKSAEEALSLFFLGATNRITSATPMNHASSRSHAVFTVNVEAHVPNLSLLRKTSIDNGDLSHAFDVTIAKLHLVDLAGSERVYKSLEEDADTDVPAVPSYVAHDAKTRLEGRNINLSLHFLEQVIVSLQTHANHPARDTHVPYRNSVLTSYLRDALGGNCRTSFIVTLSLAARHIDESVSTCRFANRCAQLQVTIERNEPRNYAKECARLRSQNKALASCLTATELLVDRCLSAARILRQRLALHGPLTLDPADMDLAQALVRQYTLNDSDAVAAVHGDDTLRAGQMTAARDGAAAAEAEPHFQGVRQEEAVDAELALCTAELDRDEGVASGSLLREVARLLRWNVVRAQEQLEASQSREAKLAEQLAVKDEECQALQIAITHKEDECRGLHEQLQGLRANQGARGRDHHTPTEHGTQHAGPVQEEKCTAPTEASTPAVRLASALVREPSAEAEARLRGLLVQAMSTQAVWARTRLLDDQLSAAAKRVPVETLTGMLLTGGLFMKHGRFGKPHARWIWLSPDGRSLLWRRHGEAILRGSVPLDLFQTVRLGVSNPTGTKHADTGRHSFALVGKDKQMHLQVDSGNLGDDSAAMRDIWARAFMCLLASRGQAN